MILKIIEKYIDRRNYRGLLRRTFLYNYYKFLKFLINIFNPRLINLLSRDVFIRILNDTKSSNVYSHWFNSFHIEPENPIKNLYSENPLPWLYIKAVHYIEFYIYRLKDKPTVFEFGGGTSTLYFAKKASKAVTLENDFNYYNSLKKRLDELEIKNVELIYIKPEPISIKSDIQKKYQIIKTKGPTTYDQGWDETSLIIHRK